MRRLACLLAACLLPWLLVSAAQGQPVADAGEDLVVECASGGARVTLDGTGSSAGPDVVYAWSAPGVRFDDPASPTPTGTFPPGETLATLVVTQTGATPESAEDTVRVTVQDTSPPTVTASASPEELWPPNHELRTVEVRIEASDACDGPDDLEVVLEKVTSNEPENGRGDGNTAPDVADAELGSDDRLLSLRAERAGGGSGRVYTALYRVRDGSGNGTPVVARVRVPHDRRGGPGPDDDAEGAAQRAEAAEAAYAEALAAYAEARQALVDAKAAVKTAKKAAKQASKEARSARRAAERATR
jgi:hypothetical protein